MTLLGQHRQAPIPTAPADCLQVHVQASPRESCLAGPIRGHGVCRLRQIQAQVVKSRHRQSSRIGSMEGGYAQHLLPSKCHTAMGSHWSRLNMLGIGFCSGQQMLRMGYCIAHVVARKPPERFLKER